MEPSPGLEQTTLRPGMVNQRSTPSSSCLGGLGSRQPQVRSWGGSRAASTVGCQLRPPQELTLRAPASTPPAWPWPCVLLRGWCSLYGKDIRLEERVPRWQR